MTLLFRDPIFLEHNTGRHPECAARLRAVAAKLAATGLADRCPAGQFPPLTADDVATLHPKEMIERARLVAEVGGGRLDPDTIVSPASYQVALAAAGACTAAAEAVVTGEAASALCLVRPPGHHATDRRSMGFCLFNNIALAARLVQQRHGVGRILIVDWDVHHGNGTQDIFWADGAVMFVSIHRFGGGFYPGTGAADETGSGPGLGKIRNVPLRYGTSRAVYLDCFRGAVEKAADDHKPELVLLSAGFDAHAFDPIGSLGLETEDFGTMTSVVLDVARTHAGGRLVSCLEGGYHLEALADSVNVHLETLLHG